MTFSCIKFKKKFKMKFNLSSGCATNSSTSNNDGTVKEPNSSTSSRTSSPCSSYKSYSNNSNLDLNNSKTGLCKNNQKNQNGSINAIKVENVKKGAKETKEMTRKNALKNSKKVKKDKKESKKTKEKTVTSHRPVSQSAPPPNPPSIDSIPSLPSSFLAPSVITSNSLLTTGTSSYSANSSALLMKNKSSRSSSSGISNTKNLKNSSKADSKMEKLEKIKDAKYQKELDKLKKKKEKDKSNYKQEIYEKINMNGKQNDHLYCPLDFSNTGKTNEQIIQTPKFDKAKARKIDKKNTDIVSLIESTRVDRKSEKKDKASKNYETFKRTKKVDTKQDEYNYAVSQKSTSASESKSKTDNDNLAYEEEENLKRVVPEVYDEYIDNTSNNNSDEYEYEDENNENSCKDCKKNCNCNSRDDYEREYVYEYEYEEQNVSNSEIENYDEDADGQKIEEKNYLPTVENEYDAVDSCDDDALNSKREKNEREKNFGSNYFKLIDDETYLDLNEVTMSHQEILNKEPRQKKDLDASERDKTDANMLDTQNDVDNLETEGEQELEFNSENSEYEPNHSHKSINQSLNFQNEYELKFAKCRYPDDNNENSVTCTSF